MVLFFGKFFLLVSFETLILHILYNLQIIRLYVKSQNPFKMSFKLKLCSFVSIPCLLKKEINTFDSFGIKWLVVTVLSVDVKYGNTT